MANFARSLAGGFKTGLEIGDALEARRQRERIAALMKEQPTEITAGAQPAQEPAQERGLLGGVSNWFARNVFGPEQVSLAQPAPAAPGAPTQAAQPAAAGPAAPQGIATPMRYQFAGRQFAERPTDAQVAALRAERLADLIAESDPAAALRLRMEQAREARAAEADKRQAELFGLTKQRTELDIRDTERRQKQESATQKAGESMAAWVESGNPLDDAAVARIARETGASLDSVYKLGLSQLGFSTEQFNAQTRRLMQDLSKASGSLDTMNKFLANTFDPDATDGISPTVVQTKDGLQVMYGGKPLAGYDTYRNLNELVYDVQGRIQNDPLGTAKMLADLRDKESLRKYRDALAAAAGQGGALDKKISDLEKTFGRKLTTEEVETLAGLAPRPRSAPDIRPADVIGLADKLMGTPVLGADGRPRLDANGKPMRYDMRTAMEEARRQLGAAAATAEPGLPAWSAAPATAAPVVPRPVPASTGLSRTREAVPVDPTVYEAYNVAP